MSTPSGCVSFKLGEEGFGIPLDQVREIARAERITPVPQAPPAVRGLLNLRGQPITVLDLARLFEIPAPPGRSAKDRLVVVLSPPYGHIGLLVHLPVEISHANLEAIPGRAAAGRAAQGLEWPEESASQGPAAVSGRIVQLLSAQDLVSHCEARVFEGFRRKS